MSAVQLVDVHKRYGDTVAVDGVSLDVAPGEALSIVGPSGCGKSTVCKVIAGVESASAGEVYLDGARATHLPPYRRPVRMMWQSGELFPHLTVAGQIAFPLRMRGVPRARIEERIDWVAKRLQIDRLRHRYPGELSGGERQRAALGRAIADPDVRTYLLDEPLAAVDAHLRRDLQALIRALHHELGCTIILVTHDRAEALGLSDRIAVMHAGRIEQVGTPYEVYRRPRTVFVARFLGDINLFAGAVHDGRLLLDGGVPVPRPEFVAPGGGGSGCLGVRPEDLHVADGDDEAFVRGGVEEVVVLGATTRLRVATAELGTVDCDVSSKAARKWLPGDRVGLSWSPQDAVFWDGA